MELDFFKTVRLFLPTLLLLYAFVPGTLKAFMPYAESFGGGDYLLEIYYKSNPEGPLRNAPSEPVAFDAVFLTKDREERISGQVTGAGANRRYSFISQAGTFEGQIVRRAGKCEPQLRFNLKRESNVIDSGLLQGAFCS